MFMLYFEIFTILLNKKITKMAKRIFFLFSSTLLALLIVSVAIIYWQQFNHINEEIINHTKRVQQLFKMKLDEEAKVLESQITSSCLFAKKRWADIPFL